jgi:hypothetical protein
VPFDLEAVDLDVVAGVWPVMEIAAKDTMTIPAQMQSRFTWQRIAPLKWGINA